MVWWWWVVLFGFGSHQQKDGNGEAVHWRAEVRRDTVLFVEHQTAVAAQFGQISLVAGQSEAEVKHVGVSAAVTVALAAAVTMATAAMAVATTAMTVAVPVAVAVAVAVTAAAVAMALLLRVFRGGLAHGFGGVFIDLEIKNTQHTAGLQQLLKQVEERVGTRD